MPAPLNDTLDVDCDDPYGDFAAGAAEDLRSLAAAAAFAIAANPARAATVRAAQRDAANSVRNLTGKAAAGAAHGEDLAATYTVLNSLRHLVTARR